MLSFICSTSKNVGNGRLSSPFSKKRRNILKLVRDSIFTNAVPMNDNVQLFHAQSPNVESEPREVPNLLLAQDLKRLNFRRGVRSVNFRVHGYMSLRPDAEVSFLEYSVRRSSWRPLG